MNDRADFLTAPRGPLSVDPRLRSAPKENEEGEEACLGFGYLRGMHERSLTIEFRLRNGNREWYPYSLLGPCRFNPSVGILLRFAGDAVTLVLIRGSNLDLPVHQGAVDLIDRGLEKHRVVWVREMDEQELRRAGEREPTIDRIEIAEFESQEEIRGWLEQAAPAFLRR